MDRPQLEAVFDQQSASYDQQWAKLAALRDGMLLLAAAEFGSLPPNARLLCVGAGTGAEMQFFAERFPGWRFVAVEPSAGMVAVAQARAEREGYAARCRFHTGYLESLPSDERFDGATALLVSQFLLDPAQRRAFFQAIAQRLQADGLLVSADLAADPQSTAFPGLLALWMRTLAGADLSAERMLQMREAYERDVAILPPQRVEAILADAGFPSAVRFYQAGLINAWYSRARRGPAG